MQCRVSNCTTNRYTLTASDLWRIQAADMPVQSNHPDYDATLPAWLRARDIVAGEDAVKAAGEKYLPRLNSQSADEYRGYKSRASFFNAAARTAEGFVGLIFRRDPVVRVPSNKDTLSTGLAKCIEDLDLLGTALTAYARNGH